MSLWIGVVIVVMTVCTYIYVISVLRHQALGQIEKYVVERGQRESAIFALAEDNHATFKGELLKRLGELGNVDPIDEFNALVTRHEDSIYRNRPEMFDGRVMPGVFIEETLEIDPDIRRRVIAFYENCLRFGPALRIMESQLVQTLVGAGYVEVCTPFMQSKGMLVKMGISEKHPLWKQIYWIEAKTCLRPMLAPHLYHLMGRTGKVWPCPIRLFEVGTCFRKESKGSKHLSEFTMLNMVEMGIETDPQERLEEMAAHVMGSLNLSYELRRESSEVYGNTTDIMVDDLEIASGATGPHALDLNWDIAENWAGLGLGLERLVMMKEGFNNIRRAGRSLIYLDGARLNI